CSAPRGEAAGRALVRAAPTRAARTSSVACGASPPRLRRPAAGWRRRPPQQQNAESRPSPHRAPEERAPRGALAGPPTGSHDGLASVAALFARGRTSMPGDASRRALAPRLLVPSSALLWGLHSSRLSPARALADPRQAL